MYCMFHSTDGDPIRLAVVKLIELRLLAVANHLAFVGVFVSDRMMEVLCDSALPGKVSIISGFSLVQNMSQKVVQRLQCGAINRVAH